MEKWQQNYMKDFEKICQSLHEPKDFEFAFGLIDKNIGKFYKEQNLAMIDMVKSRINTIQIRIRVCIDAMNNTPVIESSGDVKATDFVEPVNA